MAHLKCTQEFKTAHMVVALNLIQSLTQTKGKKTLKLVQHQRKELHRNTKRVYCCFDGSVVPPPAPAVPNPILHGRVLVRAPAAHSHTCDAPGIRCLPRGCRGLSALSAGLFSFPRERVVEKLAVRFLLLRFQKSGDHKNNKDGADNKRELPRDTVAMVNAPECFDEEHRDGCHGPAVHKQLSATL